ncbi:MAG: hypothetical protein HKO68_00175 [Desulfobacterales bacterium]|nr:hypothetical protein [Desulfobacterales bacterium]
MTREQLEHAIRATCEVSKDSEIWVLGSQAILGEFPNAPEDLCASIEVDVQPKNRPENVGDIDGTLGELSLFHQTHGFYVHGLPIEEAAALPQGWEHRAKPVVDEISTRGKIGWCIEAHDLTASKLVACREKDRDYVRVLLTERMIVVKTVIERIQLLKIDEQLRERLLQWVQITSEEL